LASTHQNLTRVSLNAEQAVSQIGKTAESTGFSFSEILAPAIAGAAVAIAPLLAVGGEALGTLLLGAQGLSTEVESGLTPAFHGLQAEAEKALGPCISAAVGELQGALPQLAPLVDVFGKAIGDAGAQFATWLNNGGIKGFVNYANAELPPVESLVKHTAVAVFSFFHDTQSAANGVLTTTDQV
jgi:hypothetical protein